MDRSFYFFVFVFYLMTIVTGDYKYYAELEGSVKLQNPAAWRDARVKCHEEGGVLASPETEELLSAMTATMPTTSPPPRVFTGIHDTYSKGSFHSLQGTPLAKIPAKLVSEQSDSDRAETCLVMHQDGTLAKNECSDILPYICYKREPTCGSKYNAWICHARLKDIAYGGVVDRVATFPNIWSREAMAEIRVIPVNGCCLWGPVYSCLQGRQLVVYVVKLYISVLILTLLASISGDWVFNSILNHSVTCDHNKTLNRDVSGLQVFFYDFKNNYNTSYPIATAAEDITKTYNLDVTRRLIFFVPGFKSNITRKPEELVRQTFKDVPDTYLIIIDHSPYTSLVAGKSDSYNYGRAVSHVYYIGQALGKFLGDLRNKGFPSAKIHCLGHSLGSQMLGYAGDKYNTLTNEKVWRITGIDPAGPCFSNSFIDEQIRSGLAEYVEVYHCNAGGLGTTSVLADADFFLNKGYKQPDCHEGIIPVKGDSDQAKCSHKACMTLWAKTVHYPGAYLAWACDSYKSFSKGKCAGNEVTIAGYSNPGNATGVFYASTDGYGN